MELVARSLAKHVATSFAASQLPSRDLGLHLLSGRHFVVLGLGSWHHHRMTPQSPSRPGVTTGCSTWDAARPKSMTLMGACICHTFHFVSLRFARHSYFTGVPYAMVSQSFCGSYGSVSCFYLFLSKRSKGFWKFHWQFGCAMLQRCTVASKVLLDPCFGARNSLV